MPRAPQITISCMGKARTDWAICTRHSITVCYIMWLEWLMVHRHGAPAHISGIAKGLGPGARSACWLAREAWLSQPACRLHHILLHTLRVTATCPMQLQLQP